MTQLPLVALNRPPPPIYLSLEKRASRFVIHRAAEVVAAYNYSLSLRHERSAIPFPTNTTMS
jgi:hypothetical protein